jgi:anti-sigma-K factor RskA
MIDDRLHELAAPYALGALDTDERREFERHLATCEACAAEVRALLPVVTGLARAVPMHEPSAALRERVLRTVAGRAPQVIAPARRTSGTFAPWALAAAALIAALGLGVYVQQLRDRLTIVERRLSEATARATVAEQQTAELRRTSIDVRTAALVLGAPDLLRAELSGREGAPNAKARAFWSRTRGLVFAAADLPTLPGNRDYQLWILGGKQPVGVAVFDADAAGRATAIVDPSASQPTPTAFAVTVEAAGGAPQPTTTPVLVGTVSN